MVTIMKNMIRSRIWRVLLISVLTGLIISIVENVSIYIITIITGNLILSAENTVFWIGVILTAVLFLITGLFCFRDMDRKDIAKSATVVVLYYIVIAALEQLLLSAGKYPIIISWLLIPVRMYSVIHQVLIRYTGLAAWIGLFISIISPYLYIIFGKQKPA